jgi:hypothetical protein
MLLRRRVDEVVDLSSRPGPLESNFSLEALEKTLVDGIVEVILSLQTTAIQVLGLESICLSGGSAWVVWQIVKTFWVLPRLADSGVLEYATKLGFESDVLRDTMPAWLRPTDIQKTFE